MATFFLQEEDAMRNPAALALALCLAVPAASGAADFATGQAEYMMSCAACHGEQGRGDGPYSELLKIASPDLTAIAARRDGKFPILEVIQIIDGRTGVRGHGGDMPIWGDRYKAELKDYAGPFGAEQMVRGRVLELTLYLQSIQQ